MKAHAGPAVIEAVTDRRRWWTDQLWRWACAGAAWGGAAMLVWVVMLVLWRGSRAWRSGLLMQGAGPTPEASGLGAALAGTLLCALGAVLLAAPVGLGAAVAIEELRPRGVLGRGLREGLRRAVQLLATAPAIVLGLVGVSLWGVPHDCPPPSPDQAWPCPPGRTLWGGSLTLGLVLSPWAARAVLGLLGTVPREARTAARALGASAWQTVRRVVLPRVWRGLPPVLLRLMAFAVAEGAALLVFVGPGPVGRAPHALGDPFTTLPVQVYLWAGHPEAGFRELAWAGLLALGVLVLTLRGGAALMTPRPGD